MGSPVSEGEWLFQGEVHIKQGLVTLVGLSDIAREGGICPQNIMKSNGYKEVDGTCPRDEVMYMVS